jgi:hypothetical protein
MGIKNGHQADTTVQAKQAEARSDTILSSPRLLASIFSDTKLM